MSPLKFCARGGGSRSKKRGSSSTTHLNDFLLNWTAPRLGDLHGQKNHGKVFAMRSDHGCRRSGEPGCSNVERAEGRNKTGVVDLLNHALALESGRQSFLSKGRERTPGA